LQATVSLFNGTSQACKTLPLGDPVEQQALAAAFAAIVGIGIDASVVTQTLMKLAHAVEGTLRQMEAQGQAEALGVLEGKALFDGDESPVYTRLAEHHGVIYLDLANERWQAVEVIASGWRVVDTPPVKFRRAR
jgi:hypothetical protein